MKSLHANVPAVHLQVRDSANPVHVFAFILFAFPLQNLGTGVSAYELCTFLLQQSPCPLADALGPDWAILSFLEDAFEEAALAENDSDLIIKVRYSSSLFTRITD